MPRDAAWYQREKERVRKWRSRKSAAGRDIAPLPPVQNPARKRACRFDLRRYCLEYHPGDFPKAFSEDHDAVLAGLQSTVLEGGLLAMAMPRGSGKTTMAEVAAEWAANYGHHLFLMLIGATEAAATESLDTIKNSLRTNKLLLEDFPEVVYPIHALEGINNRAAGQRFNGQPTSIGWGAKQIILPTIDGSPAAGVILRVAGITGRIRGAKFKRGDGQNVRPSLVIIDDPQTKKSATSPDACNKREQIVSADILGLAGPGKKISAVMPCTVIAPDDMADRMLNRELHPDWNGTRTKLLYEFPTDRKLWDEYGELRARGLKQGDKGRAATAFYKKNRKAMDAGAKPAWPARFNSDELSATQHAMNLWLRDRHSFMAEMQNEPLSTSTDVEVKILTASQICQQLNGLPRGIIPHDATRLVTFVDVSQDVLWWMAVAAADNFDAAVVDYGSWPDQNRSYYTLTDLAVTIAQRTPATGGVEGQIYAALELLTTELVNRPWKKPSGSELHISREIIDANWLTSTVYKFCRQSPHRALLLPSHGRYIGATNAKPISQYQKKDGERLGDEWILTHGHNNRGIRHVAFDTNYWKSFVHARLATAMGAAGKLTLFGDDPHAHRMLGDHLASEKPIRVTAKGRTVDEWKLPANRPDNHWLDTLTGAGVGLSIDGAAHLKHTEPPKTQARQRRRVEPLNC